MTEYLDLAATTPVSQRVADVVMHFMTVEFGNSGSRTHTWGSEAKKAVARSRERIAREVSARPEEVIFTSGATESDNLAIQGLARIGLESGRTHVLSCATEHKAVLEPLKRLASLGFDVELLEPGTSGVLEVGDVLNRVRESTLLVSLMHVNNETGVIQPVGDIARNLVQTPTYLHVDAAQSFTKVEPEVLAEPIDLVSMSGHKIGAPKGIGALVVRRRGWDKLPLEPLLVGGGQERGLRAGTLPVALIAGFAEAVRERSETRDVWTLESAQRKQELLDWASSFGAEVNGSLERSAPHIVNLYFPGRDAEALILELQDEMAVAAGSACTSATYTPSHVLKAMGFDDARAESSLRFSWDGSRRVER